MQSGRAGRAAPWADCGLRIASALARQRTARRERAGTDSETGSVLARMLTDGNGDHTLIVR